MSINPSSTTVLVTGANGFIGLHTVAHLLELGYRVRGTVRDETREKNVRWAMFKQVDTSRLEFAYTDLLKDEGWREAIQGCNYVIHVASPFPAVDPKDPAELIAPARDGTLRVLRAAQSGGVKRVVLVSSVVAITSGHERENRTFDESDWTDLEKTNYAYSISKTLAERAAWDFINSAENQSGMELVAVNPSNVFGPPLDGSNFTSVEWFRTLLHAEVPGIPNVQLNFVDVRDLVALFVLAMTVPEAAGKRFIANAASIPLAEFAEILKRNFNGRGFRVPTRVLPDALVRLTARFMPKLRAVANQLDWEHTLSTEQARSVLGWEPHPYKETIVEMAEGLIANGQCVIPGEEGQHAAVHNA